MSAKIAVFDVDGTLTRTSQVDDECWIRAVRETFGVDGICTDWGRYRNSTDEAILSEIIETHLGRNATAADLDAMRTCFAGHIARAAHDDASHFAPMPGAATLLRALPQRGWRPAIATGGWKRTALLKLATAGLPIDGVPAAFADDAHPRVEIIRTALRRLQGASATRPKSEDRVVYVGDGVWDVTAARAGGYGFVGVAMEPRASKLRAAGAISVLPDLADLERVVECLERHADLASSPEKCT